MWLLTILSGVTTLVLALLLPETFEGYILLQRAKRIRALTGNSHVRAQSELDQAATTVASLTKEALLRPLIISIEPVVFFTSIYLGVAYACFYLFFESFPIVFTEMHGFNLASPDYPSWAWRCRACWYSARLHVVSQPLLQPLASWPSRKASSSPRTDSVLRCSPRSLCPSRCSASAGLATSTIHWIVPIIFSAFLLPGVFLLFQSLLVYLPMSYPKYAASVLAANDLIRSTIAAAFPLFGHAMFKQLGVGVGCSVLGAIFAFFDPPAVGAAEVRTCAQEHSKYAHVY